MAAIEWTDILVAGLGVVGGGGGVVALYRARTQNKVDERRQLTDEQVAFRAAMAAELAALRQQITDLSRRNDVLEDDAKEQARVSAGLQKTNEYQAAELAEQRSQIAQLQQANAALQTQVAQLIEEKAMVIQRLTVSEAQRSFLERENNQLRQELGTLRGRLATPPAESGD